MRLRYFLASLVGLALFTATTAIAQTGDREATREQLRTMLAASGPKVNISFHQADKNPWNFVGTLDSGLTNTEYFEVVVGVSTQNTISFRVYPHYRGTYINLSRAANPLGLARQLLQFSHSNFLFWGADETADIFAGYTFTLESGFPDRAIEVVLYSIKALDEYVGKMKANVDAPQKR